MFPNFWIGNENETQYCHVLGLGTGMKTVFPTKVGKELTKESWEKVGNGNSRSCLAHFHQQGWRMQAISKAVSLRASIPEDVTRGAKKATGGNQRMLPMHKLGPHAGTMPEQRS